MDASEILARRRKTIRAFSWVLGYYLFIVLVGFKLGSLAFMAAFVAVEANVRWYKMLALIVSTIIILEVFRKYLNVFWPLGILGDFLEESVPWMF